jgi:hypothetical protein
MSKSAGPVALFCLDASGAKYVLAGSLGCDFWIASYDGLSWVTFDGQGWLRLEQAIEWAERETGEGGDEELLAAALPRMREFASLAAS